jgi:anti-sigma factor RsiW
MTLTCDQASELLTAYLDGELADAERAAVEAHLSGCPACQSRVEALRSAIAALATLPGIESSAGFEARVLGAFDRPRTRRPHWARRVAVALVTGGAVAAAVLIALPGKQLPGTPSELAMAADLDLLENYDAVQASDAVSNAEDVEIVAALDQLMPGDKR